MRRPNRNIEIFSLSVLDLFAAAMGAFIAIAVILFPSYMKSATSDKEAKNLLQELAACRSATNACQAEARSSFLVVVMEWARSGYDVDLHVVDNKGREFYYSKSNDPNNPERHAYPETPARLSYDNQRGPGVEIWENPSVEAGTYCIAYHLYCADTAIPEPQRSVNVRSRIYYRRGVIDLLGGRPVSLTPQHQSDVVAAFSVDSNGELKVIQPAPNQCRVPETPAHSWTFETGTCDMIKN